MVPVYCIFYFFIFFHLMHNQGSLPQVITTHFDPVGTATKTLSRDDFILYHIGFSVFMSGIFPFVGYLLCKLPTDSIIVPNKDYWFAPERKQETISRLRGDFGWLGLVAGGTVVAVDHKMMKAAAANLHGVPPEEFKTILLVAGGLMIFFLMRMVLRFRRPQQEPPPDSESGA